MHINFKYLNNLAESMPPVIDRVFKCLTKMNLQRKTVFSTEFEHSTLTLKVQRLCMVHTSHSQKFYLTVKFYKFATAAGS